MQKNKPKIHIRLGSVCPIDNDSYKGEMKDKCISHNQEDATCRENFGEACVGVDVITLPLTPLRSYLIALVTLAKESKWHHLAADAQETLDEIERQLGGDTNANQPTEESPHRDEKR